MDLLTQKDDERLFNDQENVIDPLYLKYGAEIAMINQSLSLEDLLCEEDEEAIMAKIQVTIKCNLTSYYRMKGKWLQYYQKFVYDGYHQGNMAIARCCSCKTVIDVWPCKERRMYDLPDIECMYCKGHEKLMPSYEWKNYDKVRCNSFTRHYVVNFD